MLVRQATGNLTAEAKTVLMEVISSMEDAAVRRDRRAWLVADDCWHDTLYAAASNARAKQTVSSINAQWRWVRLGLIALEDRMSQSAQKHRAVLERVLAGDAEGAAAPMSEHLSRVKRYRLNLLANFPLLFAQALERR